MNDKHQLRDILLEKRNNLTKEQVNNASKLLNENIIKTIELNHKKIAFYKSIENEVNPQLALAYAINNNSECYLPTILRETKNMSFVEYTNEKNLNLNKFLIPEPISTNSIPASSLDIIFVPLVGFDSTGNRIGRGAGYYDRALEFKKNNRESNPKLIGLGYELQLTENFSAESHDVKLDQVITEKNNYEFNLVDS